MTTINQINETLPVQLKAVPDAQPSGVSSTTLLLICALQNSLEQLTATPSNANSLTTTPTADDDDWILPYLYPGQDISTSLYLYMRDLISDPASLTKMKNFLAFLQRLVDPQSGILKKYPQLEAFLKTLTQKSGALLVEKIVDICVQLYYFQIGGGDGSDHREFDELLNAFRGTDAISQAVQKRINEYWLNPYTNKWKEWVKQQQAAGVMSFDMAQIVYQGIWGNCIQGFGIDAWQRDFRMSLIDDLCKQYKDNPLLAILLFFTMINDADDCLRVSGMQGAIKYVTKKTGETADISSLFPKIKTKSDAVDFIHKLRMMKFELQNCGGEMDPEQCKRTIASIDSILGTKDAKGDTLEQLDIDGKSDQIFADMQSYTQPTSKEYGTFSTALTAISKSFTEISAQMNTALNDLASKDQLVNGMANKLLNDSTGIVGAINYIIQNMKQ